MLYRPLFWTAFWCEDWLHAFGYRGATNFLISSASAKTAFCLAYLIGKRRKTTPWTGKIVGLTSKRNLAFTRSLNLYDMVIEYAALESADLLHFSAGKWLYVDVAGNDDLNGRVQKSLGSSGALVAGVQLGLTNLSPSAPTASSTKFTTNTSLSAPDSAASDGVFAMEQFFMPEWLAIQRKQLAVGAISAMQSKAWRDLMQDGKDWVRIERVLGGEAVKKAYREVAEKGTDPTTGMIWSLWDTPPGLDRTALPKL